jgi:hypothetical protein
MGLPNPHKAYLEIDGELNWPPDPYKGGHYRSRVEAPTCSDPPCGGQAYPPALFAKNETYPLS